MENNLEITYLYHSGFAVKTDQHILVFDYYQDPSNSFPALLEEGKTISIFSSHAHADHFNREIGKWNRAVSAYFLSDDIKAAGGLPAVDSNKIFYMPPYATQEVGAVKVTTYGSTDAGVSFLVEVDSWRIFHAGDLNWWHWKGDTLANQKLAKKEFQREIARLANVKLDVAFFPVDSRLEECRDMGVAELCCTATVTQLVAMHTSGQIWIPPSDFVGNDKGVATWCPVTAGERLNISKN